MKYFYLKQISFFLFVLLLTTPLNADFIVTENGNEGDLIYTWQYSTDDNITHSGQMAEDLGDLLNLDVDNLHIAPGDMGGIVFTAIKALHEKIEEKEERISSLEAENRELKKQNIEFSERLTRLESLVDSLGYANKRHYDY